MYFVFIYSSTYFIIYVRPNSKCAIETAPRWMLLKVWHVDLVWHLRTIGATLNAHEYTSAVSVTTLLLCCFNKENLPDLYCKVTGIFSWCVIIYLKLAVIPVFCLNYPHEYEFFNNIIIFHEDKVPYIITRLLLFRKFSFFFNATFPSRTVIV